MKTQSLAILALLTCVGPIAAQTPPGAPEDNGRLDPPALGCRPQRLERRPGIDVQGGSTLLVCDKVRVREVARMEAPFDEHGGTLPATPAMRRN